MSATPKKRLAVKRTGVKGRKQPSRARKHAINGLTVNGITNPSHPALRDFVIELESVEQLAVRYRGIYKLDLRGSGFCPKKKANFTRCAHTKNLEEYLLDWEEDLNEKSKHEPVIRVENLVDESFPPHSFEFVLENVASEDLKEMFDTKYLIGCSCTRCSSKNCACPTMSGSKFAYDRSKRVLLKPGEPIFECNKTCACADGCPNRVVQQGRTVRVMIFRTPDGRGWGVKTLEFVAQNQFVVEYVGEIITSEEAERRGKQYDAVQQTYLFDLDYTDEDATFTIDAYRFGNVSHFINHSCDPNLRVYGVFVDCLDARLPRIGLFATRDIPAGEELTFDYLVSNSDENGTSPLTPSKHRNKEPALKRFLCACGAKNCRKYLF